MSDKVKVFRLHQEGSLLADWHESKEYDDGVIPNIIDPAGATAKRQITSIPSPFARIDLVKTAFQYIVNNGQLDGDTIYHRMVSECFDIGEIFFNIDKLKNKVRIISWDRKHDLEALLKSSNGKHQLLGKTLELYLSQDAKAYNFAGLHKIYLLQYLENGKILGGTSPITLFFSAANDLNFVDIKFLDDKLFDDHYHPLYKRDKNYQKFLNHYVIAYRSLFNDMKAFNDYLELSNQKANIVNEVKQLKPEDFRGAYSELETLKTGEVVEILGFPLRKQKAEDLQRQIAEKSEFVIDSKKYLEHKPLVLQNHFNKCLNYTNRLWDSHISVPYYDPAPIPQRILPACDIQYPYLTVSDFLEPHLIRLSYPINKNAFQTGHLSPDGGNGYLLPLKKAFFDFFDTHELLNKRIGGKPMLEMHQEGKQVMVSLHIPIKNPQEHITFKRVYEESDTALGDELGNKGKIIEKTFSVVIFPCFRVRDIDNNHYRVMLIDTTEGETDFQLKFHANAANTGLSPKHEAQRSDKSQNVDVTTRFFVLEQNFDYIQVGHAGAAGIIIPKFKDISQGHEAFTFAVDFGTTNSHIEYKTENKEACPFEITDADCQIATLHDPNLQGISRSLAPITRQFLHEFIPYTLAATSDFKFPQRTVLAQSATWAPPSIPFVLAEFNIPFTYEKHTIPKDSKLVTDLKWSNYDAELSKARITAFLEVLALLIRNKILLNGGNLAKTQLVWLYPSSMSRTKVAVLEKIWTKDLCQTYIHEKMQPKKLLEAIAPFYYYKKAHSVFAENQPVASVDIGGGTTDIVIFQNDKPIISTSFKFAGNTVFGDGYGGGLANNGFYRHYSKKVMDYLKEDPDLTQAIKDIERADKSEDVITAFFSLETNIGLRSRNNITLPFSDWLADDKRLKIVFLVFHSAIIYHLALFMQANKLAPPHTITFSGTASKILNLADRTQNLESLAKLSQHIFGNVYGQKEPLKITLEQCGLPKEITCKGAILAMGVEHPDDMKSIYIGGRGIAKEKVTYGDIKDNDIQDAIVKEVERFIELFFDLHNKMNFKDYFDIEPSLLSGSKTILKEKLDTYLQTGCRLKLEEAKGCESEAIDETLFFYPLVGALHGLASKI